MRIAYLSTDFGVPIHGVKGASVHVREMVAALADAGHEIVLFSPAIDDPASADGGVDAASRGTPGREATPAVAARVVHVPPDPRHAALLAELGRAETRFELQSRLRQELRNLLYASHFMDRVREHLEREPVDVLYERYALFGHAGVALARELQIPHLLEVNAPLADEQQRTRGLLLEDLARASERRILGASDAVLVVSRRLADFAASLGVGPERIHVMPNGVDPRRFADASECRRAAEIRASLGAKVVIGFSGSLKPWHGVETLVEAFARLRARSDAAHLLIVGDGPRRAAIADQVRAKGIEDAVTMTGAVPHSEMPRWLAAMDVAVAPYLPSDDFYFSPIKVFEYQAAGRATIASSIGQMAELLVDGETALLVSPGDAEALERSLACLVDDEALRARIAEGGRLWVTRERTWASNASTVESIARDLLARAPARAAVPVRGEGGGPGANA